MVIGSRGASGGGGQEWTLIPDIGEFVNVQLGQGETGVFLKAIVNDGFEIVIFGAVYVASEEEGLFEASYPTDNNLPGTLSVENVSFDGDTRTLTFRVLSDYYGTQVYQMPIKQ